MKRRNFFKTLTAAFVAVSLDFGMSMSNIPSFAKKGVKYIPNPAYGVAEYGGVVDGLNKHVWSNKSSKDHSPVRYNFVNGEWKEVPPYITEKA